MRNIHTVAVALVFLCGVSAGDPQQPEEADVTPAIFELLYEGVLTDEKVDQLRAALPCETVSLQRSPGMVVDFSAPFTVTFRKNGEAELSGVGFGRSGDFVGNVGLIEFGKLCHLLHDVGFEHMQSRYALGISDLPTETISVTMTSDTRTVVDYGGAGPVGLWSVQRAIQALAWSTNWIAR